MADVTAPNQTTQSAERKVLLAAILGSGMAFLDGTVVNVSLPALQVAFHATGSQLQWIVEAYALTLAALILAGGAIGDRLGRKRVYLIGVAIFAAASAWCGAVQNIHAMVAARSIQGIGAALLIPGALSIITAGVPEERRGAAIGTWSGATALAAAGGPVVGGWLVQHASWRGIFLLNLPFAIAVFALSWNGFEETRQEGAKGIDWIGSCLASAGLGLVTYALLEAPSGTTAGIVWQAITGGVLVLLFMAYEAYSSNAMAPVELFRSRNFLGANLLTLFLYAALSATLYYMPLNLIQIQGYTPTQAGAVLLPVVLMIFLLSKWSGTLVDRFGPTLPLVIGPAVTGLGFVLFAVPDVPTIYWKTWLPAGMVFGFGLAMCVAPLTTVVMNAFPEERAGVASGVNNAVSRVANLLALAVFGVVLHYVFVNYLTSHLLRLHLPADQLNAILIQKNHLAGITTNDPRVTHIIQRAFVAGFRRVMIIGAILCGISALCSALLIAKEDSPKPTTI